MMTSSPSSSRSESPAGLRGGSLTAPQYTRPRRLVIPFVSVSTDPRILVVDDDGVSRHLLGQMLAEAGLAVDVVASGAEAMAHLGSHPAPSAVLLDLVMPEPDGYA